MELIITNRSRAYPKGQMRNHQVRDVRERDESMFGFEGIMIEVRILYYKKANLPYLHVCR